MDAARKRIRHDYDVSGALAVRLRRTLWHDMTAESHAENLCRQLLAWKSDYSPQFREFLGYWRQDEWKHFSWMSGLYSAVFGISESWLAKKIKKQKADFSDIQHLFIGDEGRVEELRLCVVFAYDEILTVVSYADDRQLYGAVDSAILGDFNRIIADEANHFNNACDVLLRCHGSRLAEVPMLLRQLEAWELARPAPAAYGNTFLLDRRETEVFSSQLIARAFRLLSQRLGLAAG